MSPDRTYAALRREVYLRKPEVFKMACLRDIMSLFQDRSGATRTPFYAGFGNRLTDALSYRSVAIPSTRIFTINSNAEVSIYLLASDQYRTSYVSMRELVDHYFPPIGLLVKEGGEEFTDFNFWRDRPLDLSDFSASESESETEAEDYPSVDESVRSEDEGAEDLEASYYSRDSIDAAPGMEESMMESIEGDLEPSFTLEDSASMMNEPASMEVDEIELDDPTGQLSALDLAAEATPHLHPLDPQDDLKDLAKVLSSPERRGTPP